MLGALCLNKLFLLLEYCLFGSQFYFKHEVTDSNFPIEYVSELLTSKEILQQLRILQSILDTKNIQLYTYT